MSLLLLGVLGIAPTSGILFVLLKLLYIRWKCRHIPSPKTSSFVLGHLYEIKKEQSKGHGEIDSLILKWHSEVGGVFVMYTLWDAMVMVLDPKHIQAIYAANPPLHKYKKHTVQIGYTFGERFVGKGLLPVYDNDLHKRTRQLYDEAFNADKLYPKFFESVEDFIKRLKPLADGKTQVSLKKQVYAASMDVISKVLFSFDFEKEWKGRSFEIKHMGTLDIYTLWDLALEGSANGALDPFFKFLHPFKAEGYREVSRTLRMIGREWIQKRIKAIENKETVPNDVLTRTLKLASKDQLADLEHLVDHFANFHTGGAEPVATALSFTLVLIHLNPEEGLKPLMSEIDEVLGKKKTITVDDLEKLKYTEQVVLEAMRMYFPATPIPKESPSEGISLDGHFIPPGIPIATHGGAMGRMPQYFEEPDTFKPSRFAPDKKRPGPFVFFPYGLGDRSCVGIRVAKVMNKLLLARLLQVYQIKLPDGYKLEAQEKLIKRSYNDIDCTLTLRN
ncbi:hypothetical protein EMCRGX_G029129 [Ephydatia muelleri]